MARRSLNAQQSDFARDFALLILFAIGKGFTVQVAEVRRTQIVQDDYLRRGLTTVKNSLHMDSLAGDIQFFKGGVYINGLERMESKRQLQEIGDFWESLDRQNAWGGNWKTFIDTPHFERKRE